MKRLTKSRNKMISGVCAGVAEYFNIDPTIARLAFAALVIFGGTGIVIYIIAAIILPEAPFDTFPPQDWQEPPNPNSN